MATRYGSAVITTPSECELAITRSFDAPAALVWEAFTNPRSVTRWWGPSFARVESCEIDLRVGGTWRYVLGHDDGRRIVFHGTYREIDPPRRIVATESMEGTPGEVVNTTTFDEQDGVTTVTIVARTGSREERDAMIATGMESGVQDHYDQLDAILAARDTPAEQFRHMAGLFADRIARVPVEAWGNASPCDGWSARDVVGHMVEWMPAFLDSIGVPVGPGPVVAADPAAAWAHVAAQIQAVLDDPAAATREFTHEHLGTDTVEHAVGMIMIGDIVIHTWDVARATGGDEALDPATVHDMLIGMEAMGDALAQSGHYATAVLVDDDADEQTRLLALTGRQV